MKVNKRDLDNRGGEMPKKDEEGGGGGGWGPKVHGERV